MSGPKEQEEASAAADFEDRDRLSAEFHAAADDLKAHLESLPKAAAAVLPAPRRVEARAVPPPPAPEPAVPAPADKADFTIPAEEPPPVADAATSPYAPPTVAHRLGLDQDSMEASAEIPEPAPLRARRVEAADYARFDLILAMDEENLAELRADCPPEHRGKLGLLMDHAGPGHGRVVPDPYSHGPDAFERVLDLVEVACDGLMAQLARGTGNFRG